MTNIIQIDNEYLEKKIYQARGQKVMFDSDLAELYGVETKVNYRQLPINLSLMSDTFS